MDIISSLSSGVTYLLNRFFSEYSLQNWLGNLNDVRQWTEISLDLRLRSSGAIGSTCDVLAQLSVISQLGVYIMGGSCSFCRSVGCVTSGSGYHQLAFCGFCWKVKIWVEVVWVLFLFFCSFGQFPYILISDWHFTFGFWVQSFCSSVTLPRGPVCFDPFCDLCIALLVSQPDPPPPFPSCFLEKHNNEDKETGFSPF